MRIRKILFFTSIVLLLPLYSLFAQPNNILGERLRGRILLQVEKNGEAWYVHPTLMKRMFLGRPKDAFDIMRRQGVGITNSNLYKIPIGIIGEAPDSDKDGLSDYMETTISLDPNDSDTDGDGYNDKEELVNGYSPWGAGNQNIDINFAEKHKGKILLQVEKNGEAWYVNPVDVKRYFLGRPADAFNVMRSLGLGIKNEDIEKIEINANYNNPVLSNIDANNTNAVDLPGINYNPEEYDVARNEDDFDAKKLFNIDIDESYCISEGERELYKLLNEYRKEQGLAEIPLSRSLSYTAKIHSLDVVENSPTIGACTGHSWSDEGDWSSCCYTLPNPGPGDPECMWNKPRELTEYRGDGYENGMDTAPAIFKLRLHPEVAYNGIPDPEILLEGWKNSEKHNAVMTNAATWSGVTWNAVGVDVYLVNSNLWFGEEEDPADEPIFCSDNNFAYCPKLKNINLRDECYFEKAEYNNDIELCSDIIQSEFREDCYYYMILKDEGYYNCPGGLNTAENENCQKNIRFNKEVCDQLSFDLELQDRCYYYSAEINKNHEFCRLINDKIKVDHCIYGAALAAKDKTVCKKINNAGDTDLCLMEVAELIDDDSVCTDIVGDQIRNSCYHKLAGNLKNLLICKKIVNLTECIDMEISACEHYKNEGGVADCYNMVCDKMLPGERSEHPECSNADKIEEAIEFCNRIAPGLARDYCFKGKAEDLDDPLELCAYIESQDTKDNCYYDVASGSRDITICNYIAGNDLRSQCVAYLQ